MIIQYKQRLEVKGQGTYELTIKNLVNPVTLKSLMPNQPTGIDSGNIELINGKEPQILKKKLYNKQQREILENQIRQ